MQRPSTSGQGRKEGVCKGWDREGTASRPLNGSHWHPGLEEVIILLIATSVKRHLKKKCHIKLIMR